MDFGVHRKGFVGLEIPAEQLTIEEELSKDTQGEDIGRFGKVFKGRCYGLEVAVKIPKVQELTPEQLEKFKQEVAINSEINHPNVVRFLGACLQPGQFRLVTELLEGGNLGQLLANKNKPLSLCRRMKMARDVEKGMIYIHAAQLIHLDLKPENLLLDLNGTIKVADFGLTVIRLDHRSLLKGGPKGTPLWMAPEMLLGKPFDEKADVYSYGIILWQLLTREEPFSEFSELEPFIKAVAVNGYRPPIPQGTNPRLAFLISKCWHALPSLRPSFTEIDTLLLPHIIVESAIQDELGRALWKNHFLNMDVVPWEAFVVAFYGMLKLPLDIPSEEPLQDLPLGAEPADYAIRQATLPRLEEYARMSPVAYNRCVEEVKRRQGHSFYNLLKKLLVEKHHDQEVVNMERFGSIVLGLFGPLSLQQPLAIFERMASVLPRPWFYGDIDKDAAFDLLSTKPPGTFLVRFSSNPEHVGFVLSLVDQKKTVVHIRVRYHMGSPQPYSLAGEHPERTYASLEELIIHNRMLLREPCKSTGSPFSVFFVSSAFSDGRAGRGGYIPNFGP